MATTKTGSTPPFYGFTVKDGFHVLKQGWTQKSHFAAQCEALLKDFSVALEATKVAAPLRGMKPKPYFPGNQRTAASAMGSNQRERKIEASLLDRWKRGKLSGNCLPKLSALESQVPLFGARKKRDWGYVDLLGISTAGAPVIVELKAASSENPLRPVLEAVSYAIALRADWENFRKDAIAHLKDKVSRLCDADASFECVVLVQPDYCDSWDRKAKSTDAISTDGWNAFDKLLKKFKEAGYPVSFAQYVVDDGLATVTKVKL